MKKNQSLILRGIKEGLVLNTILFASYIVCFILYPFIIAVTVKNGNFSDVKLFFEMWFINLINIIVYATLFFIPSLLGGIYWIFLQEEKKRRTILGKIFVSTLVYLLGLTIVVIFTREKMELFSYDLITFIIFVSFTVLRENKLKKINKNLIF